MEVFDVAYTLNTHAPLSSILKLYDKFMNETVRTSKNEKYEQP